MTTISDDIRKLAAGIVAEIDADWSYDGMAPSDSERAAQEDTVKAFAEALMQERQRATAIERERCAKIAENERSRFERITNDPWDDGAFITAEKILAEIRNPQTP